ncbi:Hsp20/alpha crystallin family protein [Streptomyces thermocarboxydovorans]|uniref:Hsp20/alpha crystallin family protein n=1 Tax=Streptomyces thermocarboxydovorans TaxID=59298 RepID=A0ABP3SBB9_9ACTN
MTQPTQHNALTVWNPLRELEDLQARMDHLLRTTFPFPGAGFPENGGTDAWIPAADVEETEDAYLVELELPGVKKDQITVEVSEGELAIHGEIKEKERTGVIRRNTRRIGRFDYRMALPSNVDTEHIGAELTEGILTVRVPKAEKSKPQRIEIRG